MLRERVLKSWQKFKEKILFSKKRRLTEYNLELLDRLASNMMSMSLSVSHFCIMEELENKLPKIKRECLKLRGEYINGQVQKGDVFDSANEMTDAIYIGYTNIVETYQAIKKAWDDNNSGPTIEEVS